MFGSRIFSRILCFFLLGLVLGMWCIWFGFTVVEGKPNLKEEVWTRKEMEKRKKRAKQKHTKLGERTSLLSARPHNHNNPDNTLPNNKNTSPGFEGRSGSRHQWLHIMKHLAVRFVSPSWLPLDRAFVESIRVRCSSSTKPGSLLE